MEEVFGGEDISYGMPALEWGFWSTVDIFVGIWLASWTWHMSQSSCQNLSRSICLDFLYIDWIYIFRGVVLYFHPFFFTFPRNHYCLIVISPNNQLSSFWSSFFLFQNVFNHFLKFWSLKNEHMQMSFVRDWE